MSDEVIIGAVLIALITGGTTYYVTHRIDGAELAAEKQARAEDIAKVNATAAKQMADALAQKQAAEEQVSSIQQQFQTEVAQHANDSLNYRAQLLSGTQRVRVHVGSCSAATSESAAAASGNDATPAYADLSPTVAAGVYAVVDSADAEVIKLRALQAYVKGLQDAGYISK